MKHANKIMALLLAATLAGCGGGGSGTGSIQDPPGQDPDPGPGPIGERGALAGRFVDAPVQGLRYIVGPSENDCATLEANCVTDADGTFHYNSGDNVTFYLGGVELGQVVARGVVTPQVVAQAVAGEDASAEDVNHVRDNLLVFLQSFDADGDPDNGITVTPAIAAAVADAVVDFKASASAFDNTMTTLVAQVSTAPDVPETVAVRDRTKAIEHYQRSLAENIAGTYAWSTAAGVIDPNNPVRTLTLFRSGAFLFAGYENDDTCYEDGSDPMGNGIVTGSYLYDAAARTLTITRSPGVVHTTGDCGIGTGVYDVKNFDGTLLTLDERDSDESEFHFSRVEQSTTTIAGSWLLPESMLRTEPEPVVVTFFATDAGGKQGRYILGDARAENGRGMEYGCYAIDANGSASFNARNGATCANVADTNGDDGFHGIAAKSFKVDVYGRLMLVEEDDEEEGEDLVVAFMPLSGGAVGIANLAGVWFLEAELRANPEQQPFMNVLAVNRDSGDFVFGTLEQHDDPNECLTPWYESQGILYGQYEAHGNGVETGRLQEPEGWEGKGVGVVRAVIDPSKGGLDTNGDCGLHNGESEPGDDLFMFRPSPTDPDVILGWESGESESFSFRRVQSEPDSVVGAWLHYDHSGSVTKPELSVFFPGGQFFHMMYDATTGDTRDHGARRELWKLRDEAPELGFTTDGFAYCVDTIDDDDEHPDGYCEISGTRWQVNLNDERTEGEHGDGTMRKIMQP